MSISLCVKCNHYNSSIIFEGYCSKCYLEVKPLKFLKLYDELKMGPLYKKNYYYSDKYLLNYTFDKSLKNTSKFNILCYCIITINYSDFLDTALKIFKTEDVVGITSNQAKILLRKYRKSKIFNKKNDSGYQNLICGLVIDWWNINFIDHGAEAACNWSNARIKPSTKHQIRPAAFMIKKNITYPYLLISYKQSIMSLY